MTKPYLPPEFYQVARHIGLPHLPKETESTVINSDGSLTLETAIAAQSIRRWADEAVNRLDKVLTEAIVNEIATRNGYTKERTCEVVYDENGCPECGECGCVLYSTSGYCPNCGVKVVEHD